VYSTNDMKNSSTQQQTCYRMMGPKKWMAFFPFGVENAPGDYQRYAEAVHDVINDEAQR